MTPRYRTLVTGAFPRPEALVQATRDLDRGRIRPEAAEAAFAAAGAEIARLETDLGLDVRTGGHLRWPDLFRPFCDRWSGVHAGPLTRFFETNTFYRQPVFDAPVSGGGPGLSEWLPRGSGSLAVLPGPYTFASLSELGPGSGSVGAAAAGIGGALAADLASLGTDRPDHLLFQEPMLAVAPPGADWPGVREAYRRLASAASGARTAVWTYFGDAGPVLETVATLPVDVVGIDLFASNVRSGTDLHGKGLGLGLLDPSTTIPEEPEEIARLVRDVEGLARPTEVWLGPNPPLDLLPFEAATAKLRQLPLVRKALQR